jgi:type IV pilus assembly protein PilP
MRKKGNSAYFLLFIIAALFCVLYAGCKKEQKTAPVQQQPAVAPKPASPPKPVQKQQSSAVAASKESGMDFSKKKDPFKPFIEEKPPVAAAKPGAAQVKVVTKRGEALPIQSHDVAKFRLAGIITGTRENKALLIDPIGKSYVVKMGMRIGLNEGKIVRITNSAIEVVEQYRDDSGRMQKRTIKLTLPPKR